MLIAALPPPQKKTQNKTKQKLEANTNVYQQDNRFLKKNLYIYTQEYYSVIKQNELIIRTIWMNL